MKYKFIQINCRESNKVDLRQTKAVLKYKPDIIFLEYPGISNKPITKVMHIEKSVIKNYPWTKSDNYMWKNIKKLWQSGHKLQVYAVDAPHDLVVRANIYLDKNINPNKTTNIFWWIRIYLRECFMTKKIQQILLKHKDKSTITICVFIQNFHWRHIKFLLTKPNNKTILDYYFAKFKNLNKNDIPKLLKDENKILYKYWKNSINYFNTK